MEEQNFSYEMKIPEERVAVLIGKDGGTKVDLTTPPPLPEETGAEESEQPPAPPTSTGEGSALGQQPAGLPLLG